MFLGLIASLRIPQWTKNGVVFAGLIFAERLGSPSDTASACLMFAAFCLASSAGYLFNDCMDAQTDRKNPDKSHRPIASRKLPVSVALTAALVLAAGALAISLTVNQLSLWVVAAYLGLTFAYSTFFKDVQLVDAMFIALGFVLRAVGGAVALPVHISPWLLLCAFQLALLLAIGKRRAETASMAGGVSALRTSLHGLPLGVLDQILTVVAASTLVSYALYSLSPDTIAKFDTELLVLTVPFVMYGVFRYLQLVRSERGGHAPERILLGDVPTLTNIVLWILAAAAIIYQPWRT